MSSTTTTCWFTGSAATQQRDGNTNLLHIESDVCGHYALVQSLAIRRSQKKPAGDSIQGSTNCARRCIEVRRENENAVVIWTTRESADQVRSAITARTRETNEYDWVVCAIEDYLEEPVDHSQKPIALLQTFGDRLAHDRAYAEFKPTIEDQTWARIVDAEEMAIVLRYLEAENLIDMFKVDSPIKLTVKGWEALRKRNIFPSTNKVFIATAFNWQEDDSVRVEAIEAIKRACKSLGYDADTVTQHHTENITDRIMAEIRRSRFVITELTYHNRGAYYEAGYARGLGLTVFHVVREGFTSHVPADDASGKRIHFDVQQIMYRVWKNPADLEAKLKDWIEATIGRHGQ